MFILYFTVCSGSWINRTWWKSDKRTWSSSQRRSTGSCRSSLPMVTLFILVSSEHCFRFESAFSSTPSLPQRLCIWRVRVSRGTVTFVFLTVSDPGFRGAPEAETAGHCHCNCLLQTFLCQVRQRISHRMNEIIFFTVYLIPLYYPVYSGELFSFNSCTLSKPFFKLFTCVQCRVSSMYHCQ